MAARPRSPKPLRAASSVVALTGAGISAESGIPTFRGTDGLWKQYKPEDLATAEAFAKDPRLVWEWYDWRRGLIAQVVQEPESEDVQGQVRLGVTELAQRFPLYAKRLKLTATGAADG